MASAGAPKSFYEFFAGGGMARAGLGQGWQCLFANDFDLKKVEAYRANWGDGEIKRGDIYGLDAKDLPGRADLAWGSFPCQDLSLAGNGAGLSGARSEAFWGFHRIIDLLRLEGRAPRLLVIENVVGTLTSNGGRDFRDICRTLHLLGYVFGALTIDAVHFVPQSRPRLFLVAVRKDQTIASGLVGDELDQTWVSPALARAYASLPADLRQEWRWWRLPVPMRSNARLINLIEEEPDDVRWHSREETDRLIAMMSATNKQKLETARQSGGRIAGTIYRRTRFGEDGHKVQRAEVRFDGVAGCLRTPGGGSSRQFLMVVEGNVVRSRLISGREAARLMGLADEYKLPANYNEAYHLLGDGLAVPVVRYLAEGLLEPILLSEPMPMAAE